ncbi:MAG: DinB family protein [Ferruginibacter sp.]|nr:DinB family protein [Bacteroidota bacterium]MBX2918900.1 DinB family protein [Ferruginibacter sp.]MCB0710536.1 DinB family protein [Chitinophagaceae bacterium]
MKFTLSKSLEILERTPTILSTMLSGLSEDWVNCNEGENTWNAKEVVAHLIICDKTNWIPRIKIMLSDNEEKSLLPIDMMAQFEMAKNNQLESLLMEFKSIRGKSISDLRKFNLQKSDFAKTAFHPRIFEVNVQQLITTWVTHDLSHLTQISRTMAKQYKNEVGAFREYFKILM